MDLGTLDAQGYFELLQRLEGTGYGKDEDGVRATELRAWAEIAAMVSLSLDEATANLFLRSAESALDLYERTHYLVQGASLPLAARRARLLAYRQSSPMVESRLDNAFGTLLGAMTGVTQRPTDTEALAHRSGPASGLVVARREPAATTKQLQRDLDAALERGLPARAVSAGVSQRDAVYGDALEPAGIALTPAVTIAAQSKARVASLEFLPGQQLSREQWIEMQALLCWKSHGFSLDQDHQGRTVLVGEVGLGPSSTVLVDGPTANGSINWQNRFIQAWGVVATSSVADLSQATDQQRVWLTASKTGPSSGGYFQTLNTLEQPAVATAVLLQVNATGDLEVSNSGLSGTKYVTLMIRCSPPYVPSSSTDTQPWIDSAQLQRADLVDLYQAQVISDDAPGQFNSRPAGAIRRVVSSGALYYQADVGIPQGVVLDSSEDWRNRWLLVASVGHYSAAVGGAATETFPVPSTFGQIAGASRAQLAPRLFYSGPGAAAGSPTADPYQQPVTHARSSGALDLVEPDIWLFARSSDGALMCEMKEDTSAHQTASMLALIIATEPDTGTNVCTAVPVHATQVQTLDLDQPQNCGVYAQGQQGNVPRSFITDPAPRAVPTCPPLGIISEGHSPVRPRSWRVRERLGDAGDGTYEVRQKITGQRKRIASLRVAAGATAPLDDFNLPALLAPGINDQMDFRDRFVWVEGRVSSSDITVADATPASDAAATPFLGLLYTGPGTRAQSNPAVSAGAYSVLIAANVWLHFEFSRGNPGQGFHSRLVVNNLSGADVYVNCAIEASGFLGLTDRRAPGQAI